MAQTPSNMLALGTKAPDFLLPATNFNTNFTEPIALVFGNEVEGVATEVIAASDGCIEIPQEGMKHSFNISVAAGIVLWEMVRTKQSNI